MTYFLISNRGLMMLHSDPGERPKAYDPDGNPLVTVDLVIGDDPEDVDPVPGDEDVEALEDVAAEE